MLVFGYLASRDRSLVAASLPTPSAGVTERIFGFAAMPWFGVLAAALLRARRGRCGGRDERSTRAWARTCSPVRRADVKGAEDSGGAPPARVERDATDCADGAR